MIGQKCSVIDCEESAIVDVTMYNNEAFVGTGRTVSDYYGSDVFAFSDDSICCCNAHLVQYIFPLIDMKHGNTEQQIVADCKDAELWD